MTPWDEDGWAEAEAAVGGQDWDGALRVLESAPADARTFELRARAAYGAGDFEGAVTSFEALHAHLVRQGDDLGAGRAAALVAMYLMMDTGLMAPVRGWLARAERLAGDADTDVRAWVAMVRTYERLMCGDLEAAGEHAAVAVDAGQRHDVLPAVIIGRTAAARLQIFRGDLEGGLAALDDLALTLLSGEVDSLTTGMALCELICAMQGLAMYDRAAEWTRAMDRWREGEAFGGINGRCRVHRAEMLRVSGPCEEAEEEALRACEELRPWMRREFGWPLAELGTIRLRRGDLAGAEEAFLAAHDHGWTPHPGLALVRLEQGDGNTAARLVREALEHPLEVPSKERPPHGALRFAPLHDARSEIAYALGHRADAAAAAAELTDISRDFPTPALEAMAALATARVALLDDEPDDAARAAADAVAAWTAVGAPFEAATARVVLATARDGQGASEAAALERRAAADAFLAFGAPHRAAALEGHAPAAPAAPVESGATAVFRCDGDTRTLTFEDTTVLLKDLVGLRHLARLLAEPGREFHVLDLVAAEHGTLPGRAGAEGPGGAEGDTGPLLDDTAREAYRRRLAEVDDDIEEAERLNDPERRALAERDRDYLIRELTRAVGLGGRVRRGSEPAERARTSVTRSIRYALTRIGEHHPELAGHLDRTVHTGTYCRYTPDPRAPVDWQTG